MPTQLFDARRSTPLTSTRDDGDLLTSDRRILVIAAQPRMTWRWYEYLTLAAVIACVLLGTSHLWWPLMMGR